METKRLEAQEIEARYAPGDPPILAHLTLEVRPGELVGVVGPNGSGKSTLVRALSRTLRPARGAALLDGRDLYAVVSARASARQIGVVPQDTQAAFEFTVREVVAMGRAPRLPRRPFASETPADEAAVREALRLSGIEALAERLVTTLSGGERQRVLLARALAQEPDVLLLDEPTAHLDLRHQTQVLALVLTLAHEDGKAVLAVLHDLNLAASYCDRLILLHGGVIVAQGVPAQVLTAEHLQQVYGVRVWVRRHPLTQRPWLLPLPERAATSPVPRALTVHVFCGGGTGASLLFALAQRGHVVTAGGLNAGDPDAEAAELLGISYPRELPFSPLSPAVVAEMTRSATQADVVLLSGLPFGPANVAVLEAALAARRAGRVVVCVQPPDTPFAARDFTGGGATLLWERLRAAGGKIVPDADSALAALPQPGP